MLGNLSIIGAVAAIIMIPTAVFAQVGGAINPGVHVGGAVNPGASAIHQVARDQSQGEHHDVVGAQSQAVNAIR